MGRRPNAKYCTDCVKAVERERMRRRQRRRRRDPEWRAREKAKRRERRARRRAAGGRICEDCRADISERGPRSTRCEPCQAARSRERARRAYQKERGIEAEDRVCQECGTPIGDLHGGADYCEECAKARTTKRGRKYLAERRQNRAFIHRQRENWPCRRHLVELLVEQRGRCGICLEAMRADEIETWVVGRIRPESAGGLREKENCQVVHPACASRKGARWEGTMEAQVRKWAPWRVGG